ncbi:glycosyltransferase family 4 protein [Desulforamulus ruminis]|uniref:glycosyltransferase family 4 protein n=1 Tax=Desulforamulus ruminis TaxID=1564 RepID=UPI002352E6B6|nr:glycosyltransferase family 4 protein [Desulforamulus ruminis]
MKICHIYGFGPDKLGAIENYILSLQKYCNENDIEIIFVFTREPIDAFRDLFDKLNGKYYIIKHDKNIFSIGFMIRLYKFLKIHKPDIVHSHFDSVNLQAVLAASYLRVPKIFWHQRNLFGKKLNLIRNKIYCYFAKKTTRIIAVSNAVKEDLIKRGINTSQVLLLHNGIDLERVIYNKEPYFRKEQGISNNTNIILTVAQARPEKGIDILIKAIPHVRNNAEFIVVGGGPLVTVLEEQAKSCKIRNIRFLDKRNDVSAIMRESNLLVLPSIQDGLPNVIPEAMLNNLPVLASNVGGIPEFVIHSKTGLLFEPRNYKELANKINQLFDNPGLGNELAINAKEHVTKKFNISDKIAYTFAEVYKLTSGV